MLVVDASCLDEVLVGSARAEAIRACLSTDGEQAAPHLVDAEVLGVIRRQRLLEHLDATAAEQAIDDLRDWPGERYGHRSLLQRAFELRQTVRSWDALYVSLAEALDAPLLTCDARLARAEGLRCEVMLAGR